MSALIDQAAIDRVAEYFNKAVDALTPVAQRAYEISLKTIQIDALAVIIPQLILLIISGGVFIWFALKINKVLKEYTPLAKDYNANYRDSFYHKNAFEIYGIFNSILLFSIAGISGLCATVSFSNLSNVWLWMKLFCPELYLANELLNKALSYVK